MWKVTTCIVQGQDESVYAILGGRRKPKFPVSGAIEVSTPGAGTELDADLSLGGKSPSMDIPRGKNQLILCWSYRKSIVLELLIVE